jgi:demethylmenaquinone methyltransferase/2-methoxy-6-polyprenyl-1,4-benzoquinol methylase
MAPSLRPIAAEVVRRAELQAGERVLDLGTGTGIAAAAARGEGRTVIGVDAAAGMLSIARQEVPGVTFEEMDFSDLAFADATFDVVIAAHALLFAADQADTLREWLRVTRPGGRLSLSVPGPAHVTPSGIYAEIYERHGIDTVRRYPAPDAVAATVAAAGWTAVDAAADPTRAIVLADADAFRAWRGIGVRGPATSEFTPQQHRALTDEMLAATPRTVDGAYRIPFGALYLTARRPG